MGSWKDSVRRPGRPGMTGVWNGGMRFSSAGCARTALEEKDKSILDIDPAQCQSLDVDKAWQAIHYLLCKDIEV